MSGERLLRAAIYTIAVIAIILVWRVTETGSAPACSCPPPQMVVAAADQPPAGPPANGPTYGGARPPLSFTRVTPAPPPAPVNVAAPAANAGTTAPSNELPCYERLNDRTYGQCTGGRSRYPTNDEKTLAFRRCVDPALPLPPTVTVVSLEDTALAVYGDRPGKRGESDIVSQMVAKKGKWETWNLKVLLGALEHRRAWRQARLEELGMRSDQARASAVADAMIMDIGANIGTFAIPLANKGARVLGVEAMPMNQQLLHISQCVNGIGADRLTMLRTGVSDAERECQLIAHATNRGDGVLMCGDKEIEQNMKAFGALVPRGVVPLRRLDNVMAEQDMRSSVADEPAVQGATGPGDALLRRKEIVMKIDVEHHEYSAFMGGENYFTNPETRPSLIIVELTLGYSTTRRTVDLLVSWGYSFLDGWAKRWVTNAQEVKDLFAHFDEKKRRKGAQNDAYFVILDKTVAAAPESAATNATHPAIERLPRDVLQPVLER